MNAKKISCILTAGLMIAVSVSALADPPRWAPAHGHGLHHSRPGIGERHFRPAAREFGVRQPIVVSRPVVVERRVVVERPVYVERPPVVVHEQPVYYGAPYYDESPVYYGAPTRDPAVGALGGALVGAAIGSQVAHGPDRDAAVAFGAILGGLIGSGL